MLKNYTKIKTDEYRDKFYLNDEGKYHRLDEPAIEYPDGTKIWLINGNRHQNIDHSIEYLDGEKQWYFKGKAHRVGGSFSSDEEWWFIDGKKYSKKECFNKVWSL